MVAGVAGLVVVPANSAPDNRLPSYPAPGAAGPPGLSHGTYELLLIFSWAVLIFGAVVVALSLIDYAPQRLTDRRLDGPRRCGATVESSRIL
jgi:hypothetical protein